MTKGHLVLEDKTVIEGKSFGYPVPVSGEVVFSTSMVGYPESLTDPSYYGQILVSTYPLIGNYGVPKKTPYAPACVANFESGQIWVRGLVVASYIDTPSHHSSHECLSDWLKREKIPALTDIDTRYLTKKIREKGVMKGQIIFQNKKNIGFTDINEENLVSFVSVSKPILYKAGKKKFKKPVVLIDCGVKHGIIRNLIQRNFSVLRVPWNWQANEMKDYSGIIISNGPGDPTRVRATIKTVSRLLKTDIPIFGICLGNQILALAAGAKTYKLKYGHRSSNQPVQDVFTKRSYISTQNHGYAVDIKSLPSAWEEWFVNLNDGTNEGIRHKSKPFFTIQFHAEANPGPEDTTYLFDEFAKVVEEYEKGV